MWSAWDNDWNERKINIWCDQKMYKIVASMVVSGNWIYHVEDVRKKLLRANESLLWYNQKTC